jgi:predicted transcriptional regulator
MLFMGNYSEIKADLLQDHVVEAEYDRLEPEYKLIQALISLRLKKGLSQAQLADLIGSKQSAISRLESGTYNPTLSMLKKVSKALDAKLTIRVD